MNTILWMLLTGVSYLLMDGPIRNEKEPEPYQLNTIFYYAGVCAFLCVVLQPTLDFNDLHLNLGAIYVRTLLTMLVAEFFLNSNLLKTILKRNLKIWKTII
jgi:hypothetical protein